MHRPPQQNSRSSHFRSNQNDLLTVPSSREVTELARLFRHFGIGGNPRSIVNRSRKSISLGL
jgi:hypothetical protein